jgi:hypothetical protein
VRELQLYGWPGSLSYFVTTNLCDDLINTIAMQSASSTSGMINPELGNYDPMNFQKAFVDTITAQDVYFDRALSLHQAYFTSTKECRLMACNGTEEDDEKLAGYVERTAVKTIGVDLVTEEMKMSQLVQDLADMFANRKLVLRVLTCYGGFAAARPSGVNASEAHARYKEIHGMQTSIAYAKSMCEQIREHLWKHWSKTGNLDLECPYEMHTEMFWLLLTKMRDYLEPLGLTQDTPQDNDERLRIFNERATHVIDGAECYKNLTDNDALYT